MTDQRALLTQRLQRAQESLDRLVSTVEVLSDAEITQPSSLPGWTRAQVLTHVARNADGMANLAQWAMTGDPKPMYPTRAARDADIDAGAQRTAPELAADLGRSGERFARAWDGVVALDEVSLTAALDRVMHLGAPSPSSPVVTGASAPLARRREIEVHHVDLGLADHTGADWPADFAAELLDTVAPTRSGDDGLDGVARLVDDVGAGWQLSSAAGGLTLQGPTWVLALWLTGRPADAAQLIAIDEQGTSCPVPAAPAWV